MPIRKEPGTVWEGKLMGTIKITIQDEWGNVIGELADWESQLDLGKATLAEIEGAVEEVKQRTLTEIEKK